MNAVEKRRWFRFTERRLSIAAIVVLVMIAVFLYDRMCFHYANYLALHARASELAAERDQWKSQANTWEDEALHSREFNGADEASIAAPSSVVPPFAVPPVAAPDPSTVRHFNDQLRPRDALTLPEWRAKNRELKRQPGTVPPNSQEHWINGQRYYIVPLGSDRWLAETNSPLQFAQPGTIPPNSQEHWFNGQRYYIVPLGSDRWLAETNSPLQFVQPGFRRAPSTLR